MFQCRGPCSIFGGCRKQGPLGSAEQQTRKHSLKIATCDTRSFIIDSSGSTLGNNANVILFGAFGTWLFCYSSLQILSRSVTRIHT